MSQLKLVFYSGGQSKHNNLIHQALSDLAGQGKRKSMTYIPFCTEGSEVFFRRACRRYKRFGFNRFYNLPVDQALTRRVIKRALQSDLIYLAGGNTFYFLKHLRKSGMLPLLKRFASRGGTLAGLSAGAILMTHNIGLAGWPPFDADSNDVNLKNLKGLNLVDFEFYPHFTNRPRLRQALLTYSKKSSRPIFACQDGGGLIINGSSSTLFGRAHLFFKGKEIPIGQQMK